MHVQGGLFMFGLVGWHVAITPKKRKWMREALAPIGKTMGETGRAHKLYISMADLGSPSVNDRQPASAHAAAAARQTDAQPDAE